MRQSAKSKQAAEPRNIWENWLTERTIKKRYERAVMREEIVNFLLRLLLLILILVITFFIIFGAYTQDDMAMAPAVNSGDLVIYQRGLKGYQLGDVVVYEAGGKAYCGRVVARPDDTVEITEAGELKVNGYVQIEDRITNGTPPGTTVAYPLVLDTDEYFLLAEARGNARDCRDFGPVKLSQMKGRAAFLIRMNDF